MLILNGHYIPGQSATHFGFTREPTRVWPTYKARCGTRVPESIYLITLDGNIVIILDSDVNTKRVLYLRLERC